MDPENGSSTPSTETPPAPDTAEQIETTEAPITEVAEETTTEAPSGARVQDALNAFNNERLQPSTQSTPPVAPTQTEQPVGRSYDGLDDKEVRIFKRMSNDAYNYLFPIYKQWKEQNNEVPKLREDLKKLQGASYVDHEQAYQLAPEYHNMTAAIGRLEQEGEYWQQALAAVEAGQQFQDLVYDKETGKYTLSAPVDATPQAKAYLVNKLTQCHSLRGQLGNELQQFQGTFRNQHNAYLQGLSTTRDRVLEGVDAPTKKALEKASEAKLELWPLGMRQRPEVKIAAELMVINDGLLKLLIEKEGELSGRKIVNRTSQNAGPANVSGSGPVGSSTVDAALNAFKQAGFRH